MSQPGIGDEVRHNGRTGIVTDISTEGGQTWHLRPRYGRNEWLVRDPLEMQVVRRLRERIEMGDCS